LRNQNRKISDVFAAKLCGEYGGYAYEKGDDYDLLAMSAKLAETPRSPLYKGPISPDRPFHDIVTAGTA